MLVVERGVPGVRAIPLAQQVCLLGASPLSDIYVDNPYVSRMHAQILSDQGRFRIRDLGSKNGTFVNPNPPKDTDGRREESGRGVRELQGK